MMSDFRRIVLLWWPPGGWGRDGAGRPGPMDRLWWAGSESAMSGNVALLSGGGDRGIKQMSHLGAGT